MASSSVSQESLDMDDFDTMARRNRIRTHRVGRATPHRGGERGDGGGEHEREDDQQNGESNDGGSSFGLVSGGGGADHESPTRSAAARLKEKQRSRGNHLHKGKLPKDKRKLREKRRSTGVVHLPSTESTGDSLDDDDDDDDSAIHETKKNTMYNEGPSGHSHSHSHSHTHHSHHGFEGRHASTNFVSRGNKSPSDLEADLEDNQDYDSTVSHSETNLTLIGRSESSDTQMASAGFVSRQQQASAHQAKFSPEASRASAASASHRYGSPTPKPSEQDSAATRAPLAGSSNKYAISSLVSRYNREAESVSPTAEATGSREPAMTGSGSPRPLAGVSVVGVARDSGSAGRAGERGYSGYLASRFGERAGGGREKEGGGGTGGHNSNGAGGGSNSSHHSSSSTTAAARYTFGAARPFVSQFNPSNSSSGNSTTSASQEAAAAAQAALVEKQLEKEREENKRLQQQLEVKDRRIAELERQVALLNKECDELDEDNLKLQEENKALISAMQKLSTKV